MLKERRVEVNSLSSSCFFDKWFSKPLCLMFNKKRINKGNKKANKKGQVTIFIILGILLLLAIILMILLKQEIITFKIEEITLSEKGKVEDFLLDCIKNVGEEALFLAGQQGGFIEVPERYSQDVGRHIKISPFLSVPLWAKDSTIDKPTLEEIKIQVDEYVEDNVRICLLDSGAFQETYDLIENSGIISDVSFENSRTIFNLKWNVLIKDKAGEVIAEVINHVADSNVQFKKMYELASIILDREMSTTKLEYLTKDLIALEHELLPVNGVELSCKQKQWRVDEAERTLKDMLRINLRELKVQGTLFTEFPEIYPYYQNHYVWDIGETSNDLSVVFRFDDSFPFNFQVTPRKGNYLKSGQLGGEDMLPILCVQSWKFTYDVVYPVIVEIRDEISGSVFQMSFTVNLIKNNPDKDSLLYARDSLFSSATSDENFCGESSYYVPMTVKTYSLVENSKTGVYDRQPLEDVKINFNCLRYKCEMGDSEYDFENRGDVAGLSAEFPYCAAAIMRGKKDAYLEDWEYVVPEEDLVVELNLKPLFRFYLANVNVIKHKIEGRDCTEEEEEQKGEGAFCYDIFEGEELSQDETAMVTLIYSIDIELEEENEEETSIEDDSSDSIEGSSESENVGEGENSESSLDLVDIEKKGKEIHKTEFVVSKSLDQEFLAESHIEILAEADFDYDTKIYLVDENELIGMYSGTWETSWSEVGEDKKVTFHVLEVNPNDEEDFFEVTANLRKYSEEISSPQIS